MEANSLSNILSYKKWRQRIHLPQEGIYTMGHLLLPNEWEFNQLPKDLTGKSFLDVGANDGYYSFEAERRGAQRITAVDLYQSNVKGNNTSGWHAEGIQMLKQHLHSKVQIESKSIYDLDPIEVKSDVVFCSNVISWLPDMSGALKKLCDVCNDTLILKDGFLDKFNPEPVLRYEKAKGLVEFRANISFVKAILASKGFDVVKISTVNTVIPTEWQMKNLPAAASSKKVMAYDLPNTNAPSSEHVLKGEWITSEYNGFVYVRKVGWVKKEDVNVLDRYKPNPLSKAIRSVLPASVLNYRKIKTGWEPDVKSYVIEAKKKAGH